MFTQNAANDLLLPHQIGKQIKTIFKQLSFAQLRYSAGAEGSLAQISSGNQRNHASVRFCDYSGQHHQPGSQKYS